MGSDPVESTVACQKQGLPIHYSESLEIVGAKMDHVTASFQSDDHSDDLFCVLGEEKDTIIQCFTSYLKGPNQKIRII